MYRFHWWTLFTGVDLNFVPSAVGDKRRQWTLAIIESCHLLNKSLAFKYSSKLTKRDENNKYLILNTYFQFYFQFFIMRWIKLNYQINCRMWKKCSKCKLNTIAIGSKYTTLKYSLLWHVLFILAFDVRNSKRFNDR